MTLRRTRLILIALLLVAIPLAAAPSRRKKPVRRPPKVNLPGPESIVWRYCQLDLQGARLSSRASGSEQLASLLITPPPADPDSFLVTRDCKLGKVTLGATVSKVAVTYSTLGSITPDGDLVEAPKKETITYTLKKFGQDWKISAPATLPHVSPQALTVFWQRTADTTKDPDLRDRARNAVDLLSRFKEPDNAMPHPSLREKPPQPPPSNNQSEEPPTSDEEIPK